MKNDKLIAETKEEAHVILEKFLEEKGIAIQLSPINYAEVDGKYILSAPQILVSYTK
jgi:hypothetical protein